MKSVFSVFLSLTAQEIIQAVLGSEGLKLVHYAGGQCMNPCSVYKSVTGSEPVDIYSQAVI